MLVHRQRGARRPFEEAGHLALLLVLVKHLDRDALELRGLPGHVLRLHVCRAADRRLDPRLPLGGRGGCCLAHVILRSVATGDALHWGNSDDATSIKETQESVNSWL